MLENTRSWRDYDRTSGYRHIEVLPLNGAVGAEVRGVDLAQPMGEDVRDELARAYAENLVIYLRGQQHISREQHIEFAKLFGPIRRIPHIFSVEGYPDVQIVERTPDDSRRVVGEGFHNDSSYLKAPPMAVIMRAVDVPEFGGDTAFANLYLAYETLSEPMKAFCESITAVHSATRLFGSKARTKNVMMKDMAEDEGDLEVAHPLVCVHPRTGLKYLFLGPVFTQSLVGFSEEESKLLIDFLLGHIGRFAHTGRVRWENGTVLVWDNWAVHHSAIADYPGKYRYLERVTCGGLEMQGVQA